MSGPEPIKFTVDSALLRELGERLVGQPHIALAELIKNSYDADARTVTLTFTGDELIVEDDGHGMSFQDFVTRWMRIGTTHKLKGQGSPELGRTLTGSKGVGRLATQILARKMTIVSVALRDPTASGYESRTGAPKSRLHPQVLADVDWGTTQAKKDLTEITVPVSRSTKRSTFANGSACGTRIVLTDLVADWDPASFRALAREIWALQPPFDVSADDATAFKIEFVSDYGDAMAEFDAQMRSILEHPHGRISVKLLKDDPDRDVAFEFDPLAADDSQEPSAGAPATGDAGAGTDRKRRLVRHPPGKLLKIETEVGRYARTTRTRYVRVPHSMLDELDCDIRVFNLANRQADNVPVEEARDYMSQFGGVHIYDSDFRLPYYGPQDWLNIERDAARRLSRSELLPGSLRLTRAMQDLPARRRIFGTARVSTAHEAQVASSRHVPRREVLAIQSSRDRLVTNNSLKTLTGCVRLAVDLYATDVARDKATSGGAGDDGGSDPSRSLGAARDLIEAVKDRLETSQYEALADYLDDARSGALATERRTQAQTSLLGSLATVGMNTLAWEHESTKQRLLVYDAAERLAKAASNQSAVSSDMLLREAETLKSSAVRLDEVARLFRPVLSGESRDEIVELRASRVLAELKRQLRPLARGADTVIDGVPKTMRLAAGTHAGWSALLQNLLLNAYKAVLDQPTKIVAVDGEQTPTQCRLRIQDTGTGIDLTEAETYFKPFARAENTDERHNRLGLGGTGLGLTIVRVIGNDIGVRVRFVEPTKPYATCVQIEWDR